MIRKTLEAICLDQGCNPKSNIEKKIDEFLKYPNISQLLGQELHALRKLGNDGAHPILKNFEKVEKYEIKIALELLTLILKKVYESKSDEYQLKADIINSLIKE